MRLWIKSALIVVGRALLSILKYIIAFAIGILLIAICSAIPIMNKILTVLLVLIAIGLGILCVYALFMLIKEAIEDEYDRQIEKGSKR